MSGLDTSQVITDEVILHEGHVHAEEKKKAEAAEARLQAEDAKKAEAAEAHRKAAEDAKKD